MSCPVGFTHLPKGYENQKEIVHLCMYTCMHRCRVLLESAQEVQVVPVGTQFNEYALWVLASDGLDCFGVHPSLQQNL